MLKRARAARAASSEGNTKRTHRGRPHQPEMAKTLPLRCFPPGLKAVMACPPLRPALSGRPRATDLRPAPGGKRARRRGSLGAERKGAAQRRPFTGAASCGARDGGRVCRHTHSRPPAPQHTKRRPPSTAPPAPGLGTLARSLQEISSASTFCVARPGCHATQTSSPGRFQLPSAGLRCPVRVAALLLTGMAAKIPAVLPEPNPLFLWAFVGRG